MSWFRPKLTPDICQCGHGRCFHFRGWGSCNEMIHHPAFENGIIMCRCAWFIAAEDATKTEELAELKKMVGLK